MISLIEYKKAPRSKGRGAAVPPYIRAFLINKEESSHFNK